MHTETEISAETETETESIRSLPLGNRKTVIEVKIVKKSGA
jgi:hypothetical protein